MAGVSAGHGVMMARLTGGAPASPLVHGRRTYPGCRGRGVFACPVGPVHLTLPRAFPEGLWGRTQPRGQFGLPLAGRPVVGQDGVFGVCPLGLGAACLAGRPMLHPCPGLPIHLTGAG